MGRIRSGHVKRVSRKILKEYDDGSFSTEFDKNKKGVNMHADVVTKKLRNQLAGYITKLLRTRKEIKL